jgi:FkbM family methyltransferase
MSVGKILSVAFEKLPELSLKNDLRYFLAFSKLVPNFVSDLSPVKGYEMHRNLQEGDVVVDAGAYPGDYSVFAARKVGKTGKVICFEPDARNRRILQKNMEKEGVNFIIVPKGLWNENTKLKIGEFDGLHTALSADIGSTEIEVVRLDDELKALGINKVDVIKMDIEGAEIEAIQGCKETLKKNNVYVAIASYHIVNGVKTAGYMEKYLQDLGYEAKSDFNKHLTTFGWKQ